ncbi:MAG: hypothetical protein ACI8P9_003092 [Parasphingorhabdus sp.]|jgi:hypothetical protein
MNTRPDISNRVILGLLAMFVLASILTVLFLDLPRPMTSRGQLLGAIGATSLLAPWLFLLMKRSGHANNPVLWFGSHVILALTGGILIISHVARGDLFSPPGLLLLLLLVLIVHGSLMRALLSVRFSRLFARNTTATGFGQPESLSKEALQTLIDKKITLLKTLDSSAQEALFSPSLKHWLYKPLVSYRYHRLAAKESSMIGSRSNVDPLLRWSRRLHMTAALLFYMGLITHVVIVVFFAGYASDGGEITWWYITAWGG